MHARAWLHPISLLTVCSVGYVTSYENLYMIALKKLSMARWPWVLMFFTGIFGISFAYYVQVSMGVLPCAHCIMARYYLLYVSLAGLIGMTVPTNTAVRVIATLFLIFGGFMGLMNGSEHLNFLASRSSPFETCQATVDMLLPLDQYFPNLFTALGNCDSPGPIFFGFNLVFATALLYAYLLATGLLVLASQFFTVPRKMSMFRN